MFWRQLGYRKSYIFCSFVLLRLTQVIICPKCSTPFELHDDNYVLKAMKLCGKRQIGDGPENDRGESSSMPNSYQLQLPHRPSGSNILGRPPNSSPLPGILKARVKHEHQYNTKMLVTFVHNQNVNGSSWTGCSLSVSSTIFAWRPWRRSWKVVQVSHTPIKSRVCRLLHRFSYTYYSLGIY